MEHGHHLIHSLYVIKIVQLKSINWLWSSHRQHKNIKHDKCNDITCTLYKQRETVSKHMTILRSPSTASGCVFHSLTTQYWYLPFLTFTTSVVYSLFSLMYFNRLYCKQYGPRSDCSLRSSLIKGAVWSGCIVFASMINCNLKFIWIFVADVISRQHFQDKKLSAR